MKRRLSLPCLVLAVWVAGISALLAACTGCDKTIHDVRGPDRRDSQLATADRPTGPIAAPSSDHP